MESQRFEELARGLALARSRRDVVKAVFGTLLAGGAVAAQRGGALAQNCTTDADCAGGQTCVEGVCTPDGPPPCDTDEDCAGEGEICCAGGCLAIECCIDDEDPNARCPDGTSCFEGVCDPTTEPAACDSDDACAEGEICCAGFCRAIECCIDEEDPNARCPEGTSCFEGVCDPITDGGQPQQPPKPAVVALPSTGAGPVSGSGSGMLSLLLAAGAAAAAGLGIRARRAEAEADDR